MKHTGNAGAPSYAEATEAPVPKLDPRRPPDPEPRVCRFCQQVWQPQRKAHPARTYCYAPACENKRVQERSREQCALLHAKKGRRGA